MTDQWTLEPTGEGLLFERPLAGLEQIAHDRVEQTKAAHKAEATFLLLSGGNDSMVLLDTVAEHADAIVHINTGIGIPEASEHARAVAVGYGKPYLEYTPPVAYEELVLEHPTFDGLPGPGIHHIVYQRLKERCVRALVNDHRTSKSRQRFLLLTGVRKAESRRRMGLGEPVNRTGGQVWVNPLFEWVDDEMRRYRAEHDLPTSEVVANLHLSGECLCGAFADQRPKREEREAIRFFYPAMDSTLTMLEEECLVRGKTYCEWGVKRPEPEPGGKFQPLCVGCPGQGSLL